MFFKRKEKEPDQKKGPAKKRGRLARAFLKATLAGSLIIGAVAIPVEKGQVVTDAVGITAINDARPMPEIFGGVASRNVYRLDAMPRRWRGMSDNFEAEMKDPAKRAEMLQFFAQFDDLRDKTIAEKARAVDGRIDKIVSYTPDPQTYCRSEYWGTPLQTSRLKKGDCEDFAIAKYYALRHLGVPAGKMFVVAVGHDGADHVNHATLIVDVSDNRAATPADAAPGAAPYVWKPLFMELADDGIPRLADVSKSREAPFYAMNENGVWSVTPPPGRIRPPEAAPPKPPPTPPVKKKGGENTPKTPPCIPPSV